MVNLINAHISSQKTNYQCYYMNIIHYIVNAVVYTISLNNHSSKIYTNVCMYVYIYACIYIFTNILSASIIIHFYSFKKYLWNYYHGPDTGGITLARNPGSLPHKTYSFLRIIRVNINGMNIGLSSLWKNDFLSSINYTKWKRTYN